jgi:hypothetical protein
MSSSSRLSGCCRLGDFDKLYFLNIQIVIPVLKRGKDPEKNGSFLNNSVNLRYLFEKKNMFEIRKFPQLLLSSVYPSCKKRDRR